MPTTRFIPYTEAIQYDGTNSAEILALVPDYLDSGPPGLPAGIASETGGVLTLELVNQMYGPFTTVINTGDWVTYPQRFPYGHPAAGLSGLIVYPSVGNTDRVSFDEMYDPASEYGVSDPQVLSVAVGKAALPALILGGTTSPVVVFDTPMPDANYDLKWRAVSGAAVLASIVANGAVTKTASQVTIPLKAQGLASVAGVLLVEVFQLA